jgi:prevent-host-death family protein
VPHYSVATTKDQLSSLIDKALAGEEVIITRHGTPTVELRVVSPMKGEREAAFNRLRDLRETLPPSKIPIPIERFYDWLYEEEED